MARTPSNMISLGSVAPDFNLLDVTSNSNFSLTDNKGNTGTIIMFICNHCPYVKHVNPTISELAKEYQSDEIKFIAISSNDVINYPEDSPEKMSGFSSSNSKILNKCKEHNYSIYWVDHRSFNKASKIDKLEVSQDRNSLAILIPQEMDYIY